MLRVIYLVFVLFCALQLHAQFEFYTLPADLTEGANAIIREERQEFEVQSVGKGTEKYYMSLTVLNQSGNEHAQLVVPYSKLQKIKDIRATLYDKFGKQIRKVKPSEFQDRSASTGSFFDDVRMKTIDLSYTDYPYTVVFEYEMYLDGLLFYPNWSPQHAPFLAVEKSSFDIMTPATMEVRYKAYHISEEPNITIEGNKKRYRWQANLLKAYDKEPYTPVAYSDAPRVLTAPGDFEIEGYTGNMNSWESFGKFIAKLNEGTRQLPEASIARFQTLVADCSDDPCKISKLYDYLQANTRYVSIQLGIGGWRPMPAAQVDEYKYGDCKALSNYFCAMLEAVGIQGYYTLIGAGNNYNYLKRDFPSSQFNHVVVCVPQGQDTVWVECTSQQEALGYSGSFTGNRDALIITPEGGKLVKTPHYDMYHNIQERITLLQIQPDGNAEAVIRTKYSGLQQEYASYLSEMPEQKRRDVLYENIGIKNFELIDNQYVRQKKSLPVVQETLKLRLPAYAGKSGKRLFVTPNVLAQWKRIPPDDTLRLRDIQFTYFPYMDVDTVQIQVPQGYSIEHLPEAVLIESAFGAYEAGFVNSNNKIIYYRCLKINNKIQPKEQYHELVGFCKKINKADSRRLVLVQQDP